MAISKSAAGWLVDIQPGGRRGKRYRKTLATKAEALAYEAWLKTKITQSPEWQPKKPDHRRLSELIKIWFEHHGKNLRAGQNTFQRLMNLCAYIGNPYADQLRSENFAQYRAKRLAAGISPANLNREHAYLRAVFNECARLGQWSGENPLAKLRQIKVSERELIFLSIEEIKELLEELHGDASTVAQICLATGARWSEAETLRKSQVKGGQIHFTDTKSGKNRSVPVSDKLIELIETHRNGGERFFKYCYGRFREAIDRTSLELPKGQLTHILRHTFASHFMANGGNILVLQKILGHSSLTMTMRYAHLAPEHLQEAKALNPLAKLTT